MNQSERVILHVDMDAFYASIEQRDHPELAGRPLVVAGGGTRGVVSAASYEARPFGVHSAMPTKEALKRCPTLVVVSHRMDRYSEVSKAIFEIFNEFTPDIEGLSLDEAFLDLTHCQRLWPDPVAAAKQLKSDIKNRTGLTASVGVSINKLLAKLASDWNKPDGLFVITRNEAADLLAPLSIERLFGIGPKTAPRLKALGIHTFQDLANARPAGLKSVLGSATEVMIARARGLDDRPVESLREGKQLGAERTFSHDLRDRAAIRAEILKLADQVSYRLRSEGIFARRVSLKIRRADFTTYSRSKTFTRATHARQAFAEQALELWSAFDQEQPHALIRLIGVAGGQLEESVQADFFSNHTTDQKATTFSVKNTHPAAAAGELSHTLDRIQERFGQDALRRGSGFKRTT